MLVSLDIKFNRRNQKQRRNGKACCQSQSDMFLVGTDKLDIRVHLHGFLFIMHH